MSTRLSQQSIMISLPTTTIAITRLLMMKISIYKKPMNFYYHLYLRLYKINPHYHLYSNIYNIEFYCYLYLHLYDMDFYSHLYSYLYKVYIYIYLHWSLCKIYFYGVSTELYLLSYVYKQNLKFIPTGTVISTKISLLQHIYKWNLKYPNRGHHHVHRYKHIWDTSTNLLLII